MNENLSEINIEITKWLQEYTNADCEKTKAKLKSVIVIACLPIVKKVAKSFARRSSDPVEDLVQVGSIGLIKAIDSYEKSKNTSFKTYASYLITGEIRHYLRDKVSMIRAPREMRELSWRVYKITMELTEKYGKTPTDEQLALALNVPQNKIEELDILDRRTTTISFDQAQIFDTNENSETTILDKIQDENIKEEILENKLILEEALNSLPEEDRQIIMLSFYEGQNQRQISEKLNLTPMQVSRKMKKALNSLLKFVTKKGIVSYE